MRIPALSGTRLSGKLLFIPALAIGIICFMLLIKVSNKPQQKSFAETAVTARVITVESMSVVPRVLGYGFVQAGQTWDGVTEVEGRVVEINPNLKKGALLGKGELLVRIDPAKRISAKQQSTAEVNRLLAQLKELDQKEKDTKDSLAVEKQSLKLAQVDYERQRKLLESLTVSKSEVDATERTLLTQRNTVQSIQTTLNGIPSERQALLAQIQSARAQLSDAEIDLDRTYIRAPFDCRLTEVNVELGQAVKVNEIIAQADSIGASEAVAQMPLYLFRHVVPRGANPLGQNGVISQAAFQKFMKLNALVRLSIGSDTVEWTGRVARLNDSIDLETRTIGVYVAVDEPYLRAKPGARPPLLPNMFCEVELQGAPLENRIVIPREAVHGDSVYVVDKENRLHIRNIAVDFAQGNIVVLKSSDNAQADQLLAAGETLILTDVIPAIEGMLIAPQNDEAAAKSLHAEAAGDGAVR